MFKYRFEDGGGEFILVTIPYNICYNAANLGKLKSSLDLFHKYKLSVKELNMLPSITARHISKAIEESVILLETSSEMSNTYLKDFQNTIYEVTEDIPDEYSDDFNYSVLIGSNEYCNINRIKTKLLPFI